MEVRYTIKKQALHYKKCALHDRKQRYTIKLSKTCHLDEVIASRLRDLAKMRYQNLKNIFSGITTFLNFYYIIKLLYCF